MILLWHWFSSFHRFQLIPSSLWCVLNLGIIEGTRANITHHKSWVQFSGRKSQKMWVHSLYLCVTTKEWWEHLWLRLGSFHSFVCSRKLQHSSQSAVVCLYHTHGLFRQGNSLTTYKNFKNFSSVVFILFHQVFTNNRGIGLEVIDRSRVTNM